MEEIAFLSKKILELNKRLIESESAKSKFLSLIASELNNPMTALLGMIPHLEIEKGEKNERHFDLISYELLRLNFRIQNLVATAEIESGSLDVSKARLDIEELLDEVIKSLEFAIVDRNIEIKITNEVQKEIITDPKKLYLIIKNLIANGCKYGVENGLVAVVISEKDGLLCINVKNQGEGPKVQYKPEIFTRFANRVEGKHGLGLGLSIVRELCELLDGSVDYTAEDGFVTFVASVALNEGSEDSLAYGSDEFLFESFDDAIEL